LLARYGIVFVKGFFDDTSEPIYCFPEYDEYGGRRFRDERAYKKIMALLEERNEDFRLSDFYESKAKEIDRAIAKYSECKNNTDVDIFICVKISAATEEDPQASGRTVDYEYALKVYNDLQKRGVNAFFSFVTLKNNVESDDLIWVNLVKSKKMLIIGSAEEYLDSVWVKSEWKRWLYLGREKDLYICSMKHDNEYPKSILPRELGSLHPQVYTLDTYEKMINELCEGVQEDAVSEVLPPSYTNNSAPSGSNKAPTVIKPTASAIEKPAPDGKIICKGGKNEVLKHGILEIPKDAYRGREDIVSVILPDSVKVINECAFEGCSSLDSVILPESVKTIYPRAFWNCESLTKINIPSGVKMIQSHAFAGCSALRSVTIPEGVVSIGPGAFSSCSELRSITIPKSVTDIGPSAFWYCIELAKVTIPDSVTTIGNDAFQGCQSLERITIPESVTSIGSGAFEKCTCLEKITLPSNMNAPIGARTFSECGSLIKVVIPNGATAIEASAFWNCFSLEEVLIPNTVKRIGSGAFYNCGGIMSITIPRSVKLIAEEAFRIAPGIPHVYYEGTEEEWERISIDQENIGIEKSTMHFNSPLKHPANKAAPAPKPDGEIVYKDGKKEVIPYGTTELSDDIAFDENIVSVVLPTSITSIKDCAFCGCSALKSITLPESLTEICFTAFSYCTSLKSITIPEKVTTIGPNPFVGCTLNIEVSPKNEHFKVIGRHLYSIDGKKIISYVPSENENTFAIPEGITTIADHSLCGSLNLTSVTIPASVTEIGASAFFGCDCMKNVYYSGSAADWKKITIVSGNEKLNGSIFKRAKIHYNCK